MDLTEKCLESREVYKARPAAAGGRGGSAQRENIPAGGGGAPRRRGDPGLDENGCVPMVTQYRYAFSRTLLEIPAGKREPGEEPFVTAQRELKEEVGPRRRIGSPWGRSSPPRAAMTRCCICTWPGLTFGDTHPDEDEFLSVRRIPFQELVQRCPQRRDSGRQNRHRRAEGKAPAGAVIFPKKQWTSGISCGNMRN